MSQITGNVSIYVSVHEGSLFHDLLGWAGKRPSFQQEGSGGKESLSFQWKGAGEQEAPLPNGKTRCEGGPPSASPSPRSPLAHHSKSEILIDFHFYI